jgi:hypothetical protein
MSHKLVETDHDPWHPAGHPPDPAATHARWLAQLHDQCRMHGALTEVRHDPFAANAMRRPGDAAGS